MNCCQCKGIEDEFDRKYVAKALKRYRKKGLAKTTRWLVEAIQSAYGLVETGIEDLTLLDIGGGIGAIQHQLLQNGVRSASAVEISSAYLAVAREEAARLDLDNRIKFYQGDFIAISQKISAVDIVTLDRVICCYPDMPQLLTLSMEKAGKLLALVYPRDTLPIQIVSAISTIYLRLKGSSFRFYAHSSKAVYDQISSNNFKQIFYRKTLIWQVAVYERSREIK